MVQGEKRLTFTVVEAATLLGIGRNSAYEAIKAGILPSVQIGRRILIPRAALDQFLLKAGQPETGEA